MRHSCLGSMILALFLGLMVPGTGQAETAFGESVGWIVADSGLIVRGTVTDVRSDKRGDTVSDAVTVEIVEVLKGEAAKTVRFTVAHSGTGDTPSKWKDDGVELLFFFDDTDGTLGLRQGTYGWWDSAVRLDDKPERGVFTADLHRHTKAEDVLKATRKALAELPKRGKPKRHRIDVPPGTDIYDVLYGGSAVYLVVPVDDTLEAVAQNWLKTPAPAADLTGGHLRLEGVRALRHFQSDENTALLKPLLADDYSWITTDDTGRRMRVFPIRKEAHDVLTSWDVQVERPLVEEDVK